MKKRSKPAYQHKIYPVLCWSLLVAYELLVMYYSTGSVQPLYKLACYYVCNISLFYVQVALLNRTLNRQQRQYVRLAAYMVLEIVFFEGIKACLDLLLYYDPHLQSATGFLKQVFILDLFRSVYYIALACFYWSLLRIGRMQRTAEKAHLQQLVAAAHHAALEASLARSQNAYLRQQLNPHLLFNSLNFIYSSVFKHSGSAAENILLLAEIMRYSLEETDADGKVSLEKEVVQLENLIRINRYRYDYPLLISFSKQGIAPGRQIIPLVLLTLAENVFKHGDLKEQEAVIQLTVSDSGELLFYTCNRKGGLPEAVRQGTGLSNIRTRLSFTYGDRYDLFFIDGAQTFESILKIQL